MMTNDMKEKSKQSALSTSMHFSKRVSLFHWRSTDATTLSDGLLSGSVAWVAVVVSVAGCTLGVGGELTGSSTSLFIVLELKLERKNNRRRKLNGLRGDRDLELFDVAIRRTIFVCLKAGTPTSLWTTLAGQAKQGCVFGTR